MVRLSLASCHSRAPSRLLAARLVASISSRPRRLAAQLEVVDDDVERGNRRRLRIEQAFDALDLALGQAQARQAREHAAGADAGGTAPRRPVFEIALELVGADVGAPELGLLREAGGDVGRADAS